MNNRKFIKPLLRGYFHEWMFFISVGACIPLIANSTNSVELAATIVYSLGVCMMFGFSALYHRVDWRARVLIIMRKLDHSAIFIMIAGTFTPICLLVLPGDTGIQLLFIIWAIAGIGILQTILFTQTRYIYPGFEILLPSNFCGHFSDGNILYRFPFVYDL